MNFKRTIRILCVGLLFGISYVLLFPLTGGRFLHFVSVLLTPYAVLVGLTIGIVFLAIDRLRKSLVSTFLLPFVPLLLSLHFTVWLWDYSFFSDEGLPIKSLLVVVSASLIVVMTLFVQYWEMIRNRKRTAISVPLCLFLALLLGVSLGIKYLPDERIHDWVVRNNQKKKSQASFFKKPYAYPLSIPFEKGLNRFKSFVSPLRNNKTNVFILVMDASREDYFGKHLDGHSVTPYMDELAKQELYFPNYRVQAPWTKPSTASLFTGHYVRNHGVMLGGNQGKKQKDLQKNGDKVFGHQLPDRFETLAERLSNNHFQTAGVPFAPIQREFNFDQGFDYYPNRVTNVEPVFKDLHSLRSVLFRLLRKTPEKSFVYLHLNGPHHPYDGGTKNMSFWSQTKYFENGRINQPTWRLPTTGELIQSRLPTGTVDKYQEEIEFLRYSYAADYHYYDTRIVPRLIRSLKQFGLYESSLLVITSDHGEGLVDHGGYYGHGAHLYEEAINVPLLLKFPRQFEPIQGTSRRVKNWNVEAIDLTKTILDYSGIEAPDLPGNSIVPYLSQDRSDTPFRRSYSEKGLLKQIRRASYLKDNVKYIHRYQNNDGELYNLVKDPVEKNPIDDTDVRQTMKKYIDENFTEGPDLLVEPAPLKNIGDEGLDRLKGLGYMD